MRPFHFTKSLFQTREIIFSRLTFAFYCASIITLIVILSDGQCRNKWPVVTAVIEKGG